MIWRWAWESICCKDRIRLSIKRKKSWETWLDQEDLLWLWAWKSTCYYNVRNRLSKIKRSHRRLRSRGSLLLWLVELTPTTGTLPRGIIEGAWEPTFLPERIDRFELLACGMRVACTVIVLSSKAYSGDRLVLGLERLHWQLKVKFSQFLLIFFDGPR